MFRITAIIAIAFLSNMMCSDAKGELRHSLDQALITQSISNSTLIEPAAKLTPARAKIGSFLLPIMQQAKTRSSLSNTPMVKLSGGRVQVYISLRELSGNIIAKLESHDADIEVINQQLKKVQAWVDITALEQIADIEEILKISVPNYGSPSAGRVLTQGDRILGAAQLRALGASGQGVKVGIISDGANNWRTAAASGDLPASITTFGRCAVRAADPANCRPRLTCNEGTAMAEIIHDIAPNAEIAVAAVSTSLEFISQVNRLANSFDADIIVDDLGFFGEPYFEDGDLARAVSALPSDILYFSSAGNSANTHYEQEFSALGSFHNFGVQSNFSDNGIGFAIPPNRGVFVLMQWADRYTAPNSNYDLFIFDQNSNEVNRSAGLNSRAIEGACVFNNSDTEAIRFAVANKTSGDNRRLELFFLGARAIEYPIPAGSVFGHAGTRRAIAVGAINAGSSNVAFYSSHGPARVNFPSVQLRAKPDIAATDGVSVSGAGGFPSPFFGTSAAAPHAAAIAAQLLSIGGDVSPSSVRNALISTASGGGSRAAVGRGLINANRAFAQLDVNVNSDDSIPTSLGNQPAVIAPTLLLLLGDEESE